MALLFIALAAGVHIGVALGLGGVIGMFLAIGPDAALGQLATVPFSTTNSFTLAVIPLFILMGSLATQAALTTDLYRAAYNWLGRLPGGLAMATTLASAAFGAACGSSVVNSAVFTRMALPEMTRFGYSKRLSAGCIAASGTLASLIPPSILMVVYAVLTEQSVGVLLIAGLLPGILSAAIYMLGIYIRARRNPGLAPLLTQIESAAYAVSKHAAVALAEWIAINHYDDGIRVSVLCPQAVRTNIAPSFPDPDDASHPAMLDGVLEPDEVAEACIEAITEERFLVLPHPEVATYFQRKASDYDRWLRGMRRLKARLAER